MGIPVDYAPKVVSADGGATTNFALPLSRRGLLRRLRVVQLSGALDGFSFSLYSKWDAAPPSNGVVPPRVVAPTPGWTSAQAPLYLVAPTRTIASGQAGDDPAGFGLEHGYGNQDGATAASATLYLSLTVGGAGAKTFGVDVCTEEPTNL